MKALYFILVLLFSASGVFSQTQNYEGGVKYKKRKANGSVEIQPGAASTIKFNDSTTVRYTNGKVQILINGTVRNTFSATTTVVPGLTIGATAISASAAELNYTDNVTSPIQAQLNARVDTGRAVRKVIPITGAKAGATAGWVVNAGANVSLSTLPASQTNSTLVIPVSCALRVGSRITGFSLIGQVESAGNTATITADLRKLTAAAADVADASVGAMSGVASFTADGILSAANASKTGLTEVVGADETFYILITGTTAAATDIALQGVVINLSE